MDSSDDDELGERMTDADHRAVMEDLLTDQNVFRRRNNQVTNESNESDDQVNWL